ncbi:MAG: pyruvate dehydrogenase E2 component (dihydrolipoamide acetyltransferase), partial [Planctomycetota bacterium]
VAEGEIVEWKVAVGDTVTEDQPLVEVMTDKATVEIPSPRAGTIESIPHEPGAIVPVGHVIVVISGDDTAPAETKAEEAPVEAAAPAPAPTPAAAPAPAAAPTEAPTASSDKVLATPATRKLAREMGVDIGHVAGTGPRGRITKDDVRGFGSQAAPAATATAATAPTAAPVVAIAHSAGSGETRTPYRGMRRKIGDAMIGSAFTKPHFTLVEEIDMTAVYNLRKSAKEDAAARGIKLTFLPFIMKALVASIKQHPTLNGIFDEPNSEIINYEDVHIGFALDTPNGLLVPVITDANKKSILQMAGDLSRLSEAGREGSISREELNGSTITITSAGSIGGLFATPIINYPELGILGVYKIEDRPVVRDGEIVIRKMTYMSITLDHRIVDGGEAARFMNTMRRLLENPHTLLLEG